MKGNGGPDSRRKLARATLSDVAKEAGVSVMTVSNCTSNIIFEVQVFSTFGSVSFTPCTLNANQTGNGPLEPIMAYDDEDYYDDNEPADTQDDQYVDFQPPAQPDQAVKEAAQEEKKPADEDIEEAPPYQVAGPPMPPPKPA